MDMSSKYLFEKVEDLSSDEVIIYRSNLSNEDDVKKWIEEFSKKTNTCWIVRNGIYNPQRLVYHKYFVCQHSTKNKRGKDTKRNTGCTASVDVKIKKVNKGTKKNDAWLKREIPLPAIVKINEKHNHLLNTCGSLNLLRIDDVTKQHFLQYFEDGLGVAESIKQYENKILINLLNSLPQTAANSRVNPTYNMVKHLYNNWRKEHYGLVTDSIEKIKQKISYYSEQGITIDMIEGSPWAVIVITPIMKRCQELSHSAETIFLDSTSSVDATHSTLTIMLTASKAGALPIAIFIHEGQTEESYFRIFTLLKKYNISVFGGKKSPMAFMTDNSSAEKNALRMVWPESRQLLCHFHVAQAEWRWLMSSKNQIPMNERRTYMKYFQQVMYSDTESNFEEAVSTLLNSSCKGNYKKRITDFLNIKDEWVLYFRTTILTRGHNTNNYSEATMRIIKDIILQRTKAFNAVALVDYCCSVWEQYCKVRLLNFAHGRKDNTYYKLNLLENLTRNADINLIAKINEYTFSVPSLSNNNVTYEVDTNIGYCSCPYGMQGAFCKHQYLINKHFQKILPNAPPLSPLEKHALAILACGIKLSPKLAFFAGLKDDINTELVKSSTVSDTCEFVNISKSPTAADTPLNEDSTIIISASTTSNENEKTACINLLKENFAKISHMLPNTAFSVKHLKYLNTQLNKICNEQQAMSTLVNINTVFRKKKGRVIKVQPTSIARRREGVTRGCKRINSGRPAQNSIKKKFKKSHNLAENIAANTNNAILH